MSEAPAEFTAEGLTVGGGAGVLIRDLSLTARSGEVLGITGASGSGKTSLLLVLGGLEAPQAGRLLLDGRDVSLWRDTALGVILQNLHLLGVLTAHEAVAVPLQAQGMAPAEVRDRVDTVLAMLGLGDHARQLVGELSGGQRQRVAAARALAVRPDLILADEPTSALDPHWRTIVIDQLVGAARDGAMVIIASSDPEVIARCDRVVTLA